MVINGLGTLAIKLQERLLRLMYLKGYFVLAVLVGCFSAHAVANKLSSERVRVLTWNVWFDQTDETRFPAILDVLAKQRADVILLQEVTPEFLALLKKHSLSEYHLSTSRPGAAYQNIILTRGLPVYQTVVQLPSYMQRSALQVEVKDVLCGEPLTFVNVHLESPLDDNELRGQQLKVILEHVRWDESVLIGGDFNFGNGEPEEQVLEGTYSDLVDISMRGAPTFDIEHNRWAKKTKYFFETSRRLDRFYYKSVMPYGAEYRLLKPVTTSGDPLSDHYALTVDIEPGCGIEER